MKVNDRKLFANRDARRQLSQMGGIVASSPELLGAAQQFAPGGMVTPYERSVERLYEMDSDELQGAGLPRFPGSAVGYLGRNRAMEMLQGINPNIGPEEFSQMSPQERRDAGFSGSGMINRQYFDVRDRLMESQFPMQGPEMPPAEPTRLEAEEYINPVDEFGPAGMPTPTRSTPAEPVILSPAEAAAAETDGTGSTPEDRVLTAEELQDVVSTSDDPNADAATRVLSSLGDTGFDLGSVEGRISAYEELFTRMLGESDEEKRREKYMNLAMVGFAIAAGEDPSALKNIADGLLAGTAQMQESAAARRERENRIKELAIQAGIGDQQLADRLAAAAAEDVTSWIESPQGEATVELYTELTTTRNMTHEQAIAQLDELTPGLGATLQRAMSAGVAPPPTDTMPTPSVTISSQEEYDALPSGTVYTNAVSGSVFRKP